MKHTLFFFFFQFFLVPAYRAQTTVSSVKHVGNTVELTVTSDKAFYVGNNIHVLHIGKTVFKHSRQSKKSLVFLIPEKDFSLLAEGETMWMSYGDRFNAETLSDHYIQQLAKQNPNALWHLGLFSKDLLKE
ncbi:MAG TPA: hypothetical protein VD905_08940 [Flavobacteriales bacterium]|nr:hypothetical protein [Flavobacteriales bacterium]